MRRPPCWLRPVVTAETLLGHAQVRMWPRFAAFGSTAIQHVRGDSRNAATHMLQGSRTRRHQHTRRRQVGAEFPSASRPARTPAPIAWPRLAPGSSRNSGGSCNGSVDLRQDAACPGGVQRSTCSATRSPAWTMPPRCNSRAPSNTMKVPGAPTICCSAPARAAPAYCRGTHPIPSAS